MYQIHFSIVFAAFEIYIIQSPSDRRDLGISIQNMIMSIFFSKKGLKRFFFPSNELLLDQCHKHLQQLPALLRMYLDVAVITQQMLYFFQVLLVSAEKSRVRCFSFLEIQIKYFHQYIQLKDTAINPIYPWCIPTKMMICLCLLIL